MKVYVNIEEDYPVYYIYEKDRYKNSDELEVNEDLLQRFNSALNNWNNIQQEIHDLWLAKNPEPTTVEVKTKYGWATDHPIHGIKKEK